MWRSSVHPTPPPLVAPRGSDAHTFGMSDEVMRDVKLMAYHRAGGPDELLDGPESMHCNVLALPSQ